MARVSRLTHYLHDVIVSIQVLSNNQTEITNLLIGPVFGQLPLRVEEALIIYYQLAYEEK